MAADFRMRFTLKVETLEYRTAWLVYELPSTRCPRRLAVARELLALLASEVSDTASTPWKLASTFAGEL
eukprot:2296328-Alexandrium_andersonii.AAC.1